MGIWQEARGPEQIQPIKGELFRMVTSGGRPLALDFIDEGTSFEPLLNMLKRSGYWRNSSDPFKFFQSTFRQPPLTWGSRFGRISEPSLFYGGKSVMAVLYESAYYRFLAYDGMETPPPNKRLRSLHFIFKADYFTTKGILLQHDPFLAYRSALTDKVDYQHTQELGSDMRDAGVEAFEYLSARCPENEINVGIFSKDVLFGLGQSMGAPVFCETRAEKAFFASYKDDLFKPLTISRNDFLVDGALPKPA